MTNLCEENIRTTRAYIKNKLINNTCNTFTSYKAERKNVLDLFQQTVDMGESNSALLIGPRGAGKTMLVNGVLKQLQMDEHFNANAILVHLHGLVHTDDRLALKSITTQMDLDNVVGGKVFGSFADNLAFLLACLKSGKKDTSKSIIFILEEFDLFCAHHNQTLLYNLFDVSQSTQTPVCVFGNCLELKLWDIINNLELLESGITCRVDVIELFEKRVKSRYSHRQIFLFPNQTLDERLNRIKYFLLLKDDETNLHGSYITQWNKNIQTLIQDKKFRSLMERLLDIDSTEQTLKNVIVLAVSNLNADSRFLEVEHFEEPILKLFQQEDVLLILQDLSVLELCMIISMKHHVDIYDDQPFNFEMILTRYTKFTNSNSNLQNIPRPVVLKAFENLLSTELITPASAVGSGRLQKEYQLFNLSVTTEQIKDCIKNSQGLPTEVVQWASTSIV